MVAYYNEIDPFAAQWLRNLVAAGHIAPGDVDERSIEDVCPDDLKTYEQCHFFAGIGVWSHALRGAGWPDMGKPVWTGSCPCQPFSAAGKGGGFADERHLWPALYYLIAQRRPPVVFGEQVAGKDGLAWLDVVQADLEALGYACGAVVAPAAGFGAPHIRERLYWVAYAEQPATERQRRNGWESIRIEDAVRFTRSGVVDGLEYDPAGTGLLFEGGVFHPASNGWEQRRPKSGRRSAFGGLCVSRVGDAESDGRERRPYYGDKGRRECSLGQASSVDRPGPTNGFWRDVDWLSCTDDKWRPVEPGSFPLADGITGRVGRLRAYGNAIVAQQAQAFIEAAMQVAP